MICFIMKNLTGLRRHPYYKYQWIQKMSCASGSNKHTNHQSNIENLIGAVFESWKHKKDPYLNSIMQEYYLGDSEEHFPDGGTIWPTRPSSPPKLVDLIPSTKDHPFEKRVLEALCKASDSLSWFNNNSEKWRNHPGNEGRSDISCVLVGSAMGAPLRRRALMLGFMYVGPFNTYPLHAHAAEEAYHILAGRAWLTKNDSGPVEKIPGDVNVHQPYDPHSMVTKNDSVLVCWVNSGDMNGDYYFIDEAS